MAAVEFEGVHKSYSNGRDIIRDINLTIGENEFCVFVGPSGCGKSTLLRMVAGLEDISQGQLKVGGRVMNQVAPAQRQVAMVFQSYALFPHMTVFENIAFGLQVAKRGKAEIKQKVDEVAQILKLSDYLDRRPKALSGGQRQRVAIGRAMVREPGVFLFDEPLSNLDAALRAQTRYEISRLHRNYGHAATLYVTHDQVEAMTLADRIVLLNSGDNTARFGSIAQCGSPLELYRHPKNIFTAGFIGSPMMNFLAATLINATPTGTQLQLKNGDTVEAAVNALRLHKGDKVTLGIRPEDVILCLNQNTQSTVNQYRRCLQWQEHLGESSLLYFAQEGEEAFVVKAASEVEYRNQEVFDLHFPPQRCHLFDSDGVALDHLKTP